MQYTANKSINLLHIESHVPIFLSLQCQFPIPQEAKHIGRVVLDIKMLSTDFVQIDYITSAIF